jgi:hypothetical protein
MDNERLTPAQKVAVVAVFALATWGLCDLLALFIDVSFHLPK